MDRTIHNRQLFEEGARLAQLAPTQTEPPFAVTQGLVLALFVWVELSSLRSFKNPAWEPGPEPVRRAVRAR